MEEVHDEELRLNHLLQQEIEEEVNLVEANISNQKTASKQSSVRLLEELPQSSQIRIRTEFNDGTSIEELLDYSEPLEEIETEKCESIRTTFKAEKYGSVPHKSFDSRMVKESTLDQSYESIEDQKTFDSMLSFSETDSYPEAANYKSTPISTNALCVDPSRTRTIFVRRHLQQIPSTQDIRQMPELQNIFKIDVLENKHRTRLAKGLIGFILNQQPDKKLVKEDFLQLARSILEIFPSEVVETYYVPFRRGRLAKGKLFDAYNNTRTRLREAGLISRRFKSKPVDNNALGNENSSQKEGSLDIDESELNILRSGCSEWDLVLATWRNTHLFRQRELKHQNLKTHEYIEKYKVLWHEKSYELIDIDFKMLHPTSKSIYEWKLYFRKIIAKAIKVKDSRSVKEILANINETEDEDSKLALSFMLIPYILPNHTRQRTKSEIQECFISYCENTIDTDEVTENSAKRIKLESQPKVYLVAEPNKTVSVSFVDICGKRLKFENPVKAIDVCFKLFMVMHIKYPRYCAHVWIFIQKLMYEVNTPQEAVLPAINTLINDIRLDK